MGKINSDTWKEFKIEQLFHAYLSKDDIQPKNILNGTIPLVSSGKEKNGIIAYISNENAKLWQGDIITVDMFGKAFHQEKPFFCVSHGRVNILVAKKHISGYALKFIATAIEKTVEKKYEFKEMCTGTKLLKDAIKLPVDKNGEPNFSFMESYMKNLEITTSRLLAELQIARNLKSYEMLDTTKWDLFTVGNLFEKLDLKIKKSNFNKALDVSEFPNDEFNLPLVNAKHFNNGIMYYGRECDFESAEMTIDVVKNGAIATGDVYAQPHKTGVLWDAYLIKPIDEIESPQVLFFLATVLEKTIKDKFSYDDKCIWERVKKLEIKLPSNKNKRPDYQYMENYMKKIEQKTRGNMEALRVI